jgi:type 1 fimbriae regulatory protein FimB/type 1 fimbriae regulatory protein FimE
MQRKAPSLAPLPSPAGENRTVLLRRPTNAALRPREYLTDGEVTRLLEAARQRPGRYGFRDATMILVTYLHGLRVSELCALRWDQLEFARGELHVARRKGGRPSVHSLRGSELRALRRLQREQTPASPFVFTSERLAPMSPDGFRKLLARVGQAAGLPFPVHPHMLRHACGYELQKQNLPTRVIQAWLGHADIRHTVRYTELSAVPFKEVWRDKD